MRILAAAERIARPWKNGGGVTREVAVWPPGAGIEDFDWRISIAEVREAGPFSIFEGIDRVITILDGSLVLTFGGSDVELSPDSPPYLFSGDVSCSGRPVGGPVTDLNVMIRRSRRRARVARRRDCEMTAFDGAGVIVATGLVSLTSGGTKLQLEPLDAVMLEDPGKILLRGPAVAIEFPRN
jgi:environmental stress-induced protein Ves